MLLNERWQATKISWKIDDLCSLLDACGRTSSRGQIEIVITMEHQAVSALQAQALKRKEKLKALRERQLQVSSEITNNPYL